jgi:hypothetical protein
MFPTNPFKRQSYILHTTQTYAAAGNSLLKGADRYNEAARGRCMIVTTRDDQFSARVEPFTIGQRGTGKWMSYLVVEAIGQFAPSHDGSVQVSLGFSRSVSAGQVGWRLVFYLLEAAAAANALWGSIVFPIGLGLAIILGVVGVPWSMVAYIQGMRQAGRDWADLLDVIRGSLHSHTVERA